MSDDLVERVARALAVNDGKDPDAPAWIRFPGAVPFGVCWRDQYSDKARAAIAECLKWQPIESAPNGKTGYAWMLLAWGAEDDKTTGWGMRSGDNFFAVATFYCMNQEKKYEMRTIEVNPTHWLPLPEQPKEQKKTPG